MPSVAIQAIQAAAAKYGLDWRAMAAVAQAESGLNPASVGDNGTSYGLFQLHINGALGNISPAEAAKYKDPYLNAMTAARQAAPIIKGLSGPAAIAAMVNRYERPYDKPAEVARATAWFHQNLAGANPTPNVAASTTAAPATTPGVASSNTVASTTIGAPALPGPNMQFIQGILDQNAKIAHITAPQLPVNMPSLQSTLPTPPTTSPSATTTAPGQHVTPSGTPTGIPQTSGIPASGLYANPYRNLRSSTPEGTDHGYDYTGSGGITAIGPGIVRAVKGPGQTSWYGGHVIVYEITAGPQKGKYVYLAENITPTVHVGQAVNANTVIATIAGGQTEMGWAVPGTTSYFDEPRNASAHGHDFTNFLKTLGTRL